MSLTDEVNIYSTLKESFERKNLELRVLAAEGHGCQIWNNYIWGSGRVQNWKSTDISEGYQDWKEIKVIR